MTNSNRSRLFHDHIDLVKKIANKMSGRCSTIRFDDMEAAGMFGLWRASRAFDPARGVKFTTYAYYRIKGEMLAWLRDTADGTRTYPQPSCVSLNRIAYRDGGRRVEYGDILPDHRAREPGDDGDRQSFWSEATRGLPAIHRGRLLDYFAEGKLMGEIAEREGVCGQSISLSIQKSLRRIRERGDATRERLEDLAGIS